jgi:hypothetical protein
LRDSGAVWERRASCNAADETHAFRTAFSLLFYRFSLLLFLFSTTLPDDHLLLVHRRGETVRVRETLHVHLPFCVARFAALHAHLPLTGIFSPATIVVFLLLLLRRFVFGGLGRVTWRVGDGCAGRLLPAADISSSAMGFLLPATHLSCGTVLLLYTSACCSCGQAACVNFAAADGVLRCLFGFMHLPRLPLRH